MPIRAARPQDLPAILDIYNHEVRTGTALWMDRPVDLHNRQAWFETRVTQGHPVLVAVNAQDHVLGYGTYADWRLAEGFRHSVEHSLYVREEQRGQGLGLALLDALIAHARRADKHVMVAAIESRNAASIGLHRRRGFVCSGQMAQVGCKFGSWLDLTLMQLILTPHRQSP
jgi:L-amino acid N-acyltransferase YncA